MTPTKTTKSRKAFDELRKQIDPDPRTADASGPPRRS
jgi:hypothetical protein